MQGGMYKDLRRESAEQIVESRSSGVCDRRTQRRRAERDNV